LYGLHYSTDFPKPDFIINSPKPFVQQFEIAEDKRLLYAMLLQVIPY